MTSNLKAILCETQEDIDKCIKIRIEVFVDEQGYELDDELDEKDPLSDHILLLRGDDPQGTIRYYHPMGKLGRLGVLQSARGLGAGKLLVEALEDHVKTRKGKAGIAESGKSEVQIVANAQAYAEVSLNFTYCISQSTICLQLTVVWSTVTGRAFTASVAIQGKATNF